MVHAGSHTTWDLLNIPQGMDVVESAHTERWQNTVHQGYDWVYIDWISYHPEYVFAIQRW